jgi:hypothetical protein
MDCGAKKDTPLNPLRCKGFRAFDVSSFTNCTSQNPYLYFTVKARHCKEKLENQERNF